MQKNYFFKAVFTLLFCSFFSLSFAADWYLSSTGVDTNDGMTALTAVASFSQAQVLAVSGDVIHVSGMIDMWSDPANTTFTAITGGTSTTNKTGIAIAKSLTIQGTSSSTDGFQGTNGSNSTRFFQLTSASYTLILKNLKLANGVVESTSVTNGGGAIYMSNGNIVAENVLFDSNSATGNTNLTGAALYIGGANTSGTSFTNCVFTNNVAEKAGAIYINNWSGGSSTVPNIIKFEGCSFIGNESRLTNGGAALFIRSASNYTTLNLINCTIAKNKVLNTGNGGAVYMGAKSMQSTTVNIINCTITENTNAGAIANSAGVCVLSKSGNFIGTVNIQNSIIEGNVSTSGGFGDLSFSDVAPLIAPSGTVAALSINNSIIGRYGSPTLTIPAGCIGAINEFNYLTATSTPGDYKAGIATFNATNNSYPLYVGSMAIGYGASSFLTSLTPPVTTDQLGNVRTVAATNYAGAVEATVVTTTPDAPTALVATAGDGQISLAFKTAATGGSAITNYKYSTDGGSIFTICSPAQTASPIVISGLSDGDYTVMLKAVNANGDGAASVESNSVTIVTTGLKTNNDQSVSIYKNANNKIVVSTNNAGTITVCNTLGQSLLSTPTTGSTTTINKSFASGIYLVLVSIDGNIITKKIILN